MRSLSALGGGIGAFARLRGRGIRSIASSEVGTCQRGGTGVASGVESPRLRRCQPAPASPPLQTAVCNQADAGFRACHARVAPRRRLSHSRARRSIADARIVGRQPDALEQVSSGGCVNRRAASCVCVCAGQLAQRNQIERDSLASLERCAHASANVDKSKLGAEQPVRLACTASASVNASCLSTNAHLKIVCCGTECTEILMYFLT